MNEGRVRAEGALPDSGSQAQRCKLDDRLLLVATLHHGALEHHIYGAGAAVFGLAGTKAQYL